MYRREERAPSSLWDDGTSSRQMSETSAQFDTLGTPKTNGSITYRQGGANKMDASSGKQGAAAVNRFINSDADEGDAYAYEDKYEGRFAFLKQPTTQILLAVVIGASLGALLSEVDAPKSLIVFINIPGSIFLRALQCFVIPMIFAGMTTGIADVVVLGNVSAIGTRTAALFLFFTTITAILAVAVSTIQRYVGNPEQESREPIFGYINIECGEGKYYMATPDNPSVICNETNDHLNRLIKIVDLDGVVVKTESKLTFSETLKLILDDLFPKNLFSCLQNGTLLSVTVFAVFFGAAAMLSSSRENSPLLDALKQCNTMFFYIISKIIALSPIAVVSLVAGSVSSQSQAFAETLANIGVLLLCDLITLLILHLTVYPVVVYYYTRRNPWAYLRQMVPCISFGFGSASSLASLPLTIRCVQSTREVATGLSQFVVTIGGTVHKNGTAAYFVASIIFLATTSAEQPDIDWIRIIFIVVISVLSSISAAPIPNAGLIMVVSIWSTSFPDYVLPTTYTYLVASYWLFDRINTTFNILGDAYVARIVSEMVDETYQLGPEGVHRN